MWSDPAAPKVSVKIRIHSGSSFDPQDKEGVMRLVAESIFPNEDVKEFFRDELGGDLVVNCGYDYVEIVASSKPESYLSLLETLATSVINPTLDKATTDIVKAKMLAKVSEQEKTAAYQADLAVRKRLFQTFPYGRPINGSTESIKRIDFADIKFTYDRLFGADNATIAISGNFPGDVGFRAARRYFGAWLKSDKKAPSTFRQPDAAPAAVQILTSTDPDTEIRYALRGVARNDKYYAASCILSRIYEQRIRARAPEDQRSNVFVQNHANILPGTVIFGFAKIRRPLVAEVSSERPKIEASDVIAAALSDKITVAEFDSARSAALAEYDQRDIQTRWLDADTFRIASAKTEQQSFAATSIGDVQFLADLLKQQPIASVIVLPSKSGN